MHHSTTNSIRAIQNCWSLWRLLDTNYQQGLPLPPATAGSRRVRSIPHDDAWHSQRLDLSRGWAHLCSQLFGGKIWCFFSVTNLQIPRVEECVIRNCQPTLWWTNIAMEISIVNGKIHYKLPFSIAMLVYQRVQFPNLWCGSNLAVSSFQCLDSCSSVWPCICPPVRQEHIYLCILYTYTLHILYIYIPYT